MSYEFPVTSDNEILRPELLPDGDYADQLYADIHRAFWNVTDNPERAELSDQLLIVIEGLGPEERLNVVKRLWEDMPQLQNDEGQPIYLWGRTPNELKANGNGYIYAIDDTKECLGNVSELETLIRMHYMQNKFFPYKLEPYLLEEGLIMMIMAAYEKKGGQESGIKIEKLISQETHRRYALLKNSEYDGEGTK